MDIHYGAEHISYEPEDGTVRIRQTMNGTASGVTEIIKIRQGLREEAVRAACVIELEKLGYTIISPEFN